MSTPPRTSSKDGSIESLRGIAIILVVAGHVIGSGSGSGLQVAEDSWYRYLYEALRFVRMPLFTAISGYVYALRPLDSPVGWKGFVLGKARRLLLPMYTVGALEFLTRMVAPGVNSRPKPEELLGALFLGFDHFWFLQAIFMVILFVATLDAWHVLERPSPWVTLLVVAFVAGQVVPRIDFFSLQGSFYLLPFFVLGLGLRRFNLLGSKLLRWLAWAVVLAGIARQQWAWFTHHPRPDHIAADGIVLSLAAMIIFFTYRRTVPSLARLGSYAYTIYLFHVFGTASARIVTTWMVGRGTEMALLLTFTASLLAGLFVPILADRIFKKHAVTALLFLGLRRGERAA